MGLLHVRYDEVGLKGANRPQFEKKLRKNLKRQLEDFPKISVFRVRGRIVVDTFDTDPRECLPAIARCFGVASAAPVLIVERELDKIGAAAVIVARDALDRGFKTFKVEARRNDKKFPMKSVEIAPLVGSAVMKELAPAGLTVNVTKPQFTVGVEIQQKAAAVHALGVPGPGGIPVGVSGRGLVMLSGGIDSPVASWFMLKRGLHTDFVYYHSFPYTGDKAKEKVLSLARHLSRWAPDPLFCFVPPFAKIQDAIAAAGDEELRTVVLRRFMYRVAAKIAERRQHKALVTGEVVGQVASQTPENLLCVEVTVPGTLVLRPLLGMDKNEVVARAKQIGTFETSILPYEDCCSLFAPRYPATKATPQRCEAVEARLDVAALEADALERTEVWRIVRGRSPEQLEGGVRPFKWRDATGPAAPAGAAEVKAEVKPTTEVESDDSDTDHDHDEESEHEHEHEHADDGETFTTDFSEG
jgi:thiamine biosynthesis protein ThiI